MSAKQLCLICKARSKDIYRYLSVQTIKILLLFKATCVFQILFPRFSTNFTLTLRYVFIFMPMVSQFIQVVNTRNMTEHKVKFGAPITGLIQQVVFVITVFYVYYILIKCTFFFRCYSEGKRWSLFTIITANLLQCFHSFVNTTLSPSQFVQFIIFISSRYHSWNQSTFITTVFTAFFVLFGLSFVMFIAVSVPNLIPFSVETYKTFPTHFIQRIIFRM